MDLNQLHDALAFVQKELDEGCIGFAGQNFCLQALVLSIIMWKRQHNDINDDQKQGTSNK